MSTQLKLHLLGAPEVTLADDRMTGFVSRKAQALLFYLSITKQTHTRLHLANFFWPHEDEKTGLKNIRDLVSNLRHLLGSYLTITRQDMRLNEKASIWLDVNILETAVQHPNYNTLSQALALYRDDFLAGFTVHDAPAFDDWMLSQGERLRELLIQGLYWLVEYTIQHRQVKTGLALTRRLIELESWREESYRQQMQLYLYGGQTEAAIHTYNQCKSILQKAFGIDPSSQTQALYQQVITHTQPDSANHNLPRQFTPFIGRQTEIEEVRDLVLEPSNALITIKGEGGMGKTRLALQVAQEVLYDFHDGVFFISLASFTIPQNIKQAESLIAEEIALALNLSLHNQASPQKQLMAYLKNRQILLILDNFETVSMVAPCLLDWLQTAQALCLLVTSRTSLHLRAEITYRLSSLPHPTPETAHTDDAISLLVHTIQRHDRTFQLTTNNRQPLCQICTLVEGLPLALELAGHLLDGRSPEQVSHALAQDILQLNTTLPDFPDRHRGVETVFWQTWKQLSVEQQRTLAYCALFEGGVMAEALQTILPTTLACIESLCQQSLLHWENNDRLVMHTLTKAFAQQRLHEMGVDETVMARNGRYYLTPFTNPNLLHWHTLSPDITTPLLADRHNIQAAWRWAIDTQQLSLLHNTVDGLNYFLDRFGLHQQGAEQMSWAIDQLKNETNANLLAIFHNGLAWFWGQMGDFDKALLQGQKAYILAQQVNNLHVKASACWIQGTIYRYQGSYQPAYLQLRQALKISQLDEKPDLVTYTLILTDLGQVARRMGDLDLAEEYLLQAAKLAQQAFNPIFQIMAQNHLAQVFMQKGFYASMILTLQESLPILQMLEHDPLKADTHYRLACAFLFLGQCNEAKHHLTETQKLAHQLGLIELKAYLLASQIQLHYMTGNYKQALTFEPDIDSLSLSDTEPIALALAYFFLGKSHLQQGDYKMAERAYKQMVSIWQRHDAPYGAWDAMAGLAEIALLQEDIERAEECLTAVLPALSTTHFNYSPATTEPFYLYLICIRVLQMSGKQSQAKQLQDLAFQQLQIELELLPDTLPVSQFLKAFPARQAIHDWFLNQH